MYKVEAKHAAHQAHILEENGGELPERPDYEYLVRTCHANVTEHQEQGRPSILLTRAEVPLGPAVAVLQPQGELPLAGHVMCLLDSSPLRMLGSIVEPYRTLIQCLRSFVRRISLLE